ncbi:MAG TPA: SRPBCC family protein [Tepidisphaeraceae bacterium]|jgi:hypothetical protein|nr:SRPBCC family protein [Tepidisphaeraceae bacterium]
MKYSAWVGVRTRIDAPAAIVWSILTDLRQYARWNPYIIDVTLGPRPEQPLGITIASPDGQVERLRASITERQFEQTLRWVEQPKFLNLQRRQYVFHLDGQGQHTRLRHGFAVSGLARRGAWARTLRQMRLGLRLMTQTLSRVAEAGSVAAWLDPAYPRTTSDYHWLPVHQARVYHQVVKAIEIIRRSPRGIELMSLCGWSCRQAHGRSYLTCNGAIAVGYRPEKLPPRLEGLHPIIVGVLHARTFVIDGAHRIAAHLQAGKTSVAAVRLTEAETAACIRDGFQTKVRFDSVNLLPSDPPPADFRSPSLVA